jgi:hypothetical protein
LPFCEYGVSPADACGCRARGLERELKGIGATQEEKAQAISPIRADLEVGYIILHFSRKSAWDVAIAPRNPSTVGPAMPARAKMALMREPIKPAPSQLVR